MNFNDIIRKYFSQTIITYFEQGLTAKETATLRNSRYEYLKQLDTSIYKKIVADLMPEKTNMEFMYFYMHKLLKKQNANSNYKITRIPTTVDETKIAQYLLYNNHLVERINSFVNTCIFGSTNLNDYIGLPNNFRVKHISPVKNTKRAEKTVIDIPQERLALLFKNPLIPLLRKDNSLMLLGKDSVTGKALLFQLTLPEPDAHKNGFQNADVALYLMVGGTNAKQICRMSYKPDKNSVHEDIEISSNGTIKVDPKSHLPITHDVVTNVVHMHMYGNYIENGNTINPTHYSAAIPKGYNDYLKPDYTFQKTLINFMSRFNIANISYLNPNQNHNNYPLNPQIMQGILDRDNFNFEDFENLNLSQTYDTLLENVKEIQELIKTKKESAENIGINNKVYDLIYKDLDEATSSNGDDDRDRVQDKYGQGCLSDDTESPDYD